MSASLYAPLLGAVVPFGGRRGKRELTTWHCIHNLMNSDQDSYCREDPVICLLGLSDVNGANLIHGISGQGLFLLFLLVRQHHK